MLDILMLGRIFPERTSIMAKKELKYAPLLGQYSTSPKPDGAETKCTPRALFLSTARTARMPTVQSRKLVRT